ncbi:hypothetical protein TWF694_005371 [Orbilia ellipsospora]|uniref:Uncharacterized protein n=1 Tax=Orbilia ellipsospora TaxID=2528407 RepID=A0AAV9WT21_9PEZI
MHKDPGIPKSYLPVWSHFQLVNNTILKYKSDHKLKETMKRKTINEARENLIEPDNEDNAQANGNERDAKKQRERAIKSTAVNLLV